MLRCCTINPRGFSSGIAMLSLPSTELRIMDAREELRQRYRRGRSSATRMNTGFERFDNGRHRPSTPLEISSFGMIPSLHTPRMSACPAPLHHCSSPFSSRLRTGDRAVFGRERCRSERKPNVYTACSTLRRLGTPAMRASLGRPSARALHRAWRAYWS